MHLHPPFLNNNPFVEPSEHQILRSIPPPHTHEIRSKFYWCEIYKRSMMAKSKMISPIGQIYLTCLLPCDIFIEILPWIISREIAFDFRGVFCVGMAIWEKYWNYVSGYVFFLNEYAVVLGILLDYLLFEVEHSWHNQWSCSGWKWGSLH